MTQETNDLLPAEDISNDPVALAAHWLEVYANAPTINYGPPQFNRVWNPNSAYDFDLFRSATTHMVTYESGLYVMVDEPNGLTPNQDPAWVLVADIGGGGPGGGIVSINGSDEPNQTIAKLANTPITISGALGTITVGIDINSAPTFITKVTTDVLSSTGVYAAIQSAVGTNLTWNATTGKISGVAAQVSSDWNATTGIAQILNKPTIPAAQVNSDWDATSGIAQILNKPTIPAAQVNSDWAATSGIAQILNKPNVLINPMTTAGDMIVGGTAGVPTRLGKGTANQVLSMVGANLGWAANPALYQYSKYRYVDNVGGSDTNQGSFNAPYKTVAYALTQITTGMIVCLLGQTAEPALSIPATLTNIDVISFGTRSALNGFTNSVTVLGTGAGSVRFQNLNFGGGLTRASTSTCGIYIYGGSIGATGFTQSGNGYTEFVETDASNGPNTISAGRLVTNGGKLIAPVVTGTGTFVSINNAGNIAGNATVASGSVLSVILSIWVSAATGHAISSVAGSTVLLDGVQFVRSDLATLSTVSLLGNWSIQYAEFNRASSVLTGTNLASTDYFDKIGLLNTATVTGRTKQLVLDANGVVSEQLIAAPPANYQFNVPVSALYADNADVSNIVLKSISGSTQFTQKGLLANSNGLLRLIQQFSLLASSGQTVNINGRLTFYNVNAITQPNYYVNIQVVGLTAGRQLVNVGSVTQVQLSKEQYGYTNADFSATDLLVTNLIAIGVEAQLLYAETGSTAIINTMFAQMTIS